VADDASARLRALTKLPTDTPDDPALVDIDFHQGVPVSINHVEMPFVELVQSLDTIAGAHGVGRIDGREARVMYEAPAAVALYAAHAALQTAVTSAAAQELAAPIAATYVDLIQDGLWFTPARAALDDVVERLQESVTGVVRLRLHRGECQVVGCQSSSGPHDGAAVARGQEA
jgi:argininosuccinate synthase